MNKILKFLKQKNFLKQRKNVISLCSFLLFIFLILPSISFSADAGKHLGFQGQLLNTSNTPQTGTYSMTFSFYDALTAGTLQGSTITKSVTVSNGYFAVDFSESDLSGIVFNQDLWMEMTVDGTTMSPRSPVNSVPYSNVAFGVISGSGAPSISNPADGALYFDTTGNIFYVYDGASWSKVMSGSVTSADILNSTIATADLANNAVDGTKISLTSETTGDTMYYDGTNWVHSSALTNDGTDITVTGNLITGSNITGSGALSIKSANATALVLDSGTSGAINLGTSANGKNITIGNTTGTTFLTINSGADSTGGGVLINVPDNVANIFRVRQGANNYIALTTTNSSETLTFGNITTNPSFNFAGTGNGLFGGAITVTGYSTFSNGLSANSNRIQDVATPISVNDATSKNYVDTLFSSAITYTSPVYDLASSDPGVTPNTRRYIDTIDWSGCGIYSIVSSDGSGSYSCQEIAVNGLTLSVTNLGETYTFNGVSWVSTGSTVNHNSLNGIQGGQIAEYYHLNFNDYTDLTDGAAQLGELLTDGAPTFANLTSNGFIYNGDGDVNTPSYSFVNDTDTGMYRVGVNKIGFITGSSTAFVIDQNQNVGIGDFSASDPTYKLQVEGSASLGNRELVVDSSGNVGINGASYIGGHGNLPAENKLTVFGNIGNLFDDTRQSEDITQVGNTLSSFSNVISLELQGSYAFTVDNNSNQIIALDTTPDLSGANGPAEISRLNLGSTATKVKKVVGRYAYVIGPTALQIIDISDPANMVYQGEFNPSGASDIYDVEISGRFLYLLYLDEFSNTLLALLDITNPTNPINQGSYSVTQSTIDIAIQNNFIYAVDTANELLTVYNVSDPINDIYSVGTAGLHMTPSKIAVSGRYAYVYSDSKDFLVVDISNKASPVTRGDLAFVSQPSDIFVAGRYVYMPTTDNELYVVDVEDPQGPTLVKDIALPFRPYALDVQGKKIVLAGGDSIGIFDASGIETSNALVHSLEVGTLAIQKDLNVNGNIITNGGLNIGNGGINSLGDVAVGGRLSLGKELRVDDSAGISGQVLTSNGIGSAPSWANISSSVRLDQIIGATNTGITHNDSNQQTWYWSLTGSSYGFRIDEDTASSGTGYLFSLNTKLGSTAKPFTVLAHESAIIDTTSNGNLTFGSISNNTPIVLQSGTGAITIGTDANAHTITIGNVTGATAVNVNTGTGGTTYTTTNGIFTLNTGTGTITLGGDATSNTLNIGTGAGFKTVTIGSTSSSSALTLDSGTGAINIGTSIAKTITIGNTTGATALTLNSGTGAIGIGTSIAKTITIGNTTGATAVNVNTGTAGTTYTTTNGIFTLATGTGTVTLSGDSTANTINIGTGAGAKTVTLGSTNTTSSLTLNSGTGAIGIGTSIAKTITIGNVTGATAVNINAGSGGSTYTTTNSNFTLTTGTGSILIGNDSSTQNIFIGSSTGVKSMTLNTGTGTLNISTDTNANTINFGTGAAAKAITIGNTTGATALTLNSGTGAINIGTSIAKTITIGNSTSATVVNLTAGNTSSAMTIATTNGDLYLQSGSGTLRIATDATNQSIYLGSGSGVKTLLVGSTNTTSTTYVQAGTGGLNLGNDGIAHTITLGNTTGATAVNINTGTGGSAFTTTNGVFTLATGTGTVTLSGDATVNTINIGTGAAAKVITIGSTSGSLALKAATAVTIQGSGTTCSIGDGTGATSCTSDGRLKENVTDLDDSTLTKVLALRPVLFNWNSISGHDQSIAHIGLIAQEVQTQFGDAVHTVYHSDALNDDVLGVDYGYLVVPTIKAVQEQQTLMGEIITTEGMTTLVVDIQNEIARDPVVIINEKINNNTKFLTDFVVARVTAIRGYFDEIFAKKATLEEVCLKDGNGVSCYTRSQLDAVVNNTNSPTQNITNTTTNTPDTTTDVNTTPTDNTNTTQGEEVVNNPTPDVTIPTTPDSEPTETTPPESESI